METLERYSSAAREDSRKSLGHSTLLRCTPLLFGDRIRIARRFRSRIVAPSQPTAPWPAIQSTPQRNAPPQPLTGS